MTEKVIHRGYLKHISYLVAVVSKPHSPGLCIPEHQGRENSMISRRSSLTEEAAKACGDDSHEKEPGAPRTYYGGDSHD
jgi:hypothetical protein